MTYPKELLYTKSHEWVRVDGDVATVGLTHYAQDSLGDVVHFEAPSVGATVNAGTAVAEIESVKAVSDVYAPVSGEVVAVNTELDGNEDAVNKDPYGKGWLFRIKVADKAQVGALVSSDAYQALLAEQA
jgi:glycine cleavage system H protein